MHECLKRCAGGEGSPLAEFVRSCDTPDTRWDWSIYIYALGCLKRGPCNVLTIFQSHPLCGRVQVRCRRCSSFSFEPPPVEHTCHVRGPRSKSGTVPPVPCRRSGRASTSAKTGNGRVGALVGVHTKHTCRTLDLVFDDLMVSVLAMDVESC